MALRRVIRFSLWGALLLILLVAVSWWASLPARPDAFYAAPERLVPAPGMLLRQEPFHRRVPPDARAWRILYTTTRADGAPGVASAIVMISRTAPQGPRPIIAWTHGTTGVVPGCAPSLLEDPFANVPALPSLIARNWIYVGTDYIGQGTAGPHPYLIGEGQARSALDSVRAARQIAGIQASADTVVWGHSQGGNAALWTGILAPTYAPDVPIAGVAAIAPASDLRALIEVVQHLAVGRIMSSFLLRAYSETYSDVGFDHYLSKRARLTGRDMSDRCLEGRKALFSVAEAMVSGGNLFEYPPSEGSLGRRLAQNTPDRPIGPPLMIAQGLADPLVLPDIQSRFVDRRCKAGQALTYIRYDGRDHLSVVAPDSALTRDLVQWTEDRIARVPAAEGCRQELH